MTNVVPVTTTSPSGNSALISVNRGGYSLTYHYSMFRIVSRDLTLFPPHPTLLILVSRKQYPSENYNANFKTIYQNHGKRFYLI